VLARAGSEWQCRTQEGPRPCARAGSRAQFQVIGGQLDRAGPRRTSCLVTGFGRPAVAVVHRSMACGSHSRATTPTAPACQLPPAGPADDPQRRSPDLRGSAPSSLAALTAPNGGDARPCHRPPADVRSGRSRLRAAAPGILRTYPMAAASRQCTHVAAGFRLGSSEIQYPWGAMSVFTMRAAARTAVLQPAGVQGLFVSWGE
jgi:hypothetical protein